MNNVLITSQWAPIVLAKMATSPGNFIIDKFTVRNNDTVDRLFTAHLVPNGQTPDSSTIVVTVTVEAGKTYLLGELVGHWLNANDGVWVLADTVSVLSVRMSGRHA